MIVFEILVVDEGNGLRGYDCRDVLAVEEAAGSVGDGEADRFVVRLGRVTAAREIRCRKVLGFFELTPRDVRPVPPIVAERISGERPWAVGVIACGLCLLY